ncbi:hexuronate transporter [Escherichia coli]|uniref:Hexuronate transporter n=1 Tax=Escherichia coli TaxID=562 RepID=A0A376TW47_ECOLX|nr:hexuronate transporter [Escherichia coli]
MSHYAAVYRWFCPPGTVWRLITLSSDVFGRNEVATANGLTGMSAWLASTLFALVVGALADTIGFSPLFAVLAVFDLLGALVIWTVLQNKPAIEVAQEHITIPHATLTFNLSCNDEAALSDGSSFI